MSASQVMLLIDADNVSVDVIEQAVDKLLAEHGALHVRRAYCTAESAVKHQALFKRLSIRPMVNLSTGKNSTDIALAVDALDLVLSERPGLVAIASSDSDFAPLVARLREAGCRVIGIGQDGKTGEATLAVYDEFTVFSHRKTGSRAAPRVAAKTPAAAKKTARKTTAGRRSSASAKAAIAPAPPPAPALPTPPPLPAKVRQILDTLPALEQGATLELRIAAERLREAGLLSNRGSSTKVFGGLADHFELLPATRPNKVRLRA